MPFIHIDDVDLYYELDGVGGDTVAFVNGIAMTVRSWQPMRERFVASGHRCLLHDCRGQLRSGKPSDRPLSMELHAADLLALLDALDIERVHLVGTSYGAEIAMRFACSYPRRVATLTLIAGACQLDALMRAAAESWSVAADCGGVAFFRCMLPWTYSSAYLEQNRQVLLAQEEAIGGLPADYFTAFKQLVAAFLRLDIAADLRRIACPTLIVSAERDLIKGPDSGRQIHRLIVGSEFVVIPGAGHAVVLEQPDRVATEALGFIERCRSTHRQRR